MSERVDVARAAFRPQTGSQRGERIEVHFNPASLQYTVANTLERQGSGNSVKQFVSQSTAKLTMDLVFDTTDTGENVRTHTEKVARFMEPERNVPPVVEFEWGAYRFQGMVESFRETIDFFAPNGVPLRSSVNISLAAQDEVFAPRSGGTFAGVQGSLGTGAVQVPTPGGAPPGAAAAAGGALSAAAAGITALAAAAGNPRAGRAIAALNDVDSMRFPGVAEVVVTATGALDTAALLRDRVAGPGTDAGARFEVGGRGVTEGPASLAADVGRAASLRNRIVFGQG